jgi:parvulin-like peptidyl-prolyl isomerase
MTVNGEEIDDRLLREEAASLRPKYYETMGGGDPIALEMQLREWSKENVIERVLMRQEASRIGVELEAMILGIRATVPVPKQKEVAALYAKGRDGFWAPEMIHAAHVVSNVDETHLEADALLKIERAAAELARGVPFAVVADAHSDCPGQGGDLGWFPRGHMVPEFEAVVFELSVGQTSPVFRSPFGFHIARVMGKRPEGIPALADVREHLEEQILKIKQQQALEAFVDQLRAVATTTGV